MILISPSPSSAPPPWEHPIRLFPFSDSGTQDVPLVGGGGPSRRGELIELYEAVVLDKPVRHTGSWGMATLEVCLAIMQSAKERREIMLSHQVPAPEAD